MTSKNVTDLNVLHKILLDILLELGVHESSLCTTPHLGVGHQQWQHSGHVGHQALRRWGLGGAGARRSRG